MSNDNPTVAYVTAGGAGMFCGSCMRDNTLTAALHGLGYNVVLVPTFTPIRTEEEDHSLDRVFLGGINIYLEQRFEACRRIPPSLRRWLDNPRLLRWVSKLAFEQRGEEEGPIAESLLMGEEGHHKAEINDLVDWLVDDLKPDVVNLTNLLIAGFVPVLKKRRQIPVLVTLQGDDVWLDSLNETSRQRVIEGMRRVARHIDGFIVFSCYYRNYMADLIGIPHDRFHIVPLGMAEPETFAPPASRPERPPTVGYLARVCEEKGFHVLVDAFIRLKQMPGMEATRLRAAGWLGGAEREYFEAQRTKLAAAGVADAFEYVEVPDRDSKVSFLHTLDVFSVPTTYHEPKGIYVLEALAAGVPVVQPSHGAFPELLNRSGGGRLVPPEDDEALASELHQLLTDDAERRRLGDEGRQRVCQNLDAMTVARRTLEVWQRFIDEAEAGRAEAPIESPGA